MTALRFLAMVLFLVAATALATDATRASLGQGRLLTPLLKHWADLAPTVLASAKKSVVTATHPAVWDWAIVPVLSLPAWLSLGAIAIALALVARRRRKIRIYAN